MMTFVLLLVPAKLRLVMVNKYVDCSCGKGQIIAGGGLHRRVKFWAQFWENFEKILENFEQFFDIFL